MIKVCEKCGIKYDDYLVKEYIPQLNGNDYCKTCRDFLKTKVKKKIYGKITKVPIRWSHYALPGFEKAPNGKGYVKIKGGKRK
jgi:hypothetical protein